MSVYASTFDAKTPAKKKPDENKEASKPKTPKEPGPIARHKGTTPGFGRSTIVAGQKPGL